MMRQVPLPPTSEDRGFAKFLSNRVRLPLTWNRQDRVYHYRCRRPGYHYFDYRRGKHYFHDVHDDPCTSTPQQLESLRDARFKVAGTGKELI
uniref:Predicted protein n=1 Tax=Hordeum vulgare subsp. vulgare TaxID=112509 RepID=F2E0I8_HORVV|nr:predicted protein [Hordeum vulgare subsp. vulgare]